MQEPQTALSALEAWLQTRLDGNVEDWRLDEADAQRISFHGQAGFTFDWDETRSRADSALSAPPLDEQVRIALDARPLHVALTECACSRPHDWLRPVTRKPLPEHEFRHTRVETCDSCSGRKTMDCGGCGASGAVRCGSCSGSGTDRVICRGCGGAGYFPRTRIGPNNETEHYRDTCWGCGGGGRINETCGICRGSGNITCNRCGGSGQLTCTDCQGRGSRLYLYIRRALVDGRSGLALEEIEFAGWAEIVRNNWPDLVAGGAIGFANVRAKDEPASGVLRINFDAAADAARASAYAGEASAQLYAVGSQAPIVDGEPLLSHALNLPGPDADVDWVALTERLAGKRLLREAIDVTEEKAADHKGKSKGAYQEAQAAEIGEDMIRRYGALVGSDGAAALANMVMRGVEPLKDRVTRKIWRRNLGIAAVIGLVAAIAVIVVILQQQEVRETWFKVAAQILMGTAVMAVIWGVIGHWLVRRELKGLSRELDLVHPLTPPRHGWPKRGGILAVIIAMGFAAGLPLAGWKAGVPQMYAYIVDRQVEFADGPAGEIELPEAATLYKWPDENSQRLAEISANSAIQISIRRGREWRLVRYDGQHGYIRSRALGVYSEADPPSFRNE